MCDLNDFLSLQQYIFVVLALDLVLKGVHSFRLNVIIYIFVLKLCRCHQVVVSFSCFMMCDSF